jgi:hypothetical protein
MRRREFITLLGGANVVTRGGCHGIGMKIGFEVGTFQWVGSQITSPGLAMPNRYVPGEA